VKTCAACHTDNDDTRVFCLNCGQRLPQAIPGTNPGFAENTPRPVAPRISVAQPKKKSIPRRTRNAGRNLFSLFLNLAFLAVFAGLVFGIYLISQAPSAITPEVEKDVAGSTALAAFFKKASLTPGGAWIGSEESINRFLLENVKLVPLATAFGIHTEFNRCFVELGEGRLDFVMEQSLEDHPLYFALHLEPYSEGGKLKVRVLGASLGRLPVPALVAAHLLVIWQPCFDSLGAIVDTLDSASSASVTPKNLVVRWPGKGES
jgi:hypothetical protein